MAPSNPHVITQLRQLIYYHLDSNLLRNALFFAGRLQAYDSRSSETCYLLALCHLKLGQLRAAYDTSRSPGSRGTHLGCAYVFAQACLGLERYLEGATALERSKGLWSARNTWGKHSETRRQHLPDAAAVYSLQGKLWQAHCEYQKSIECYAEALKINPFMWDAFTALCDLGVNVRVPNIFKMTPEMKAQMNEPIRDQSPVRSFDRSLDEPPPNASSQTNFNIHVSQSAQSANDPFTTVSNNRLNGEIRNNASSSALFEKINTGNSILTPVTTTDIPVDDTPTGNGGIMDPDFFSAKGVEPPLAPTRKGRGIPGMGLDFNAEVPPKMRSSATVRSKSRNDFHPEDQEDTAHSKATSTMNGGAELKRTVSGKAAHPHAGSMKPNSAAAADMGAPQRKSVRLLNQLRPQSGKFSTAGGAGIPREERELRKAKAPSSKARSANTFNVGRVVSGNRKHGDPTEMDVKEQRPALTNVTSNPAPAKVVVNEKAKEAEALKWLFDLFHKLGTGYFMLSHYRCPEAISMFQSITPSQRDTAWVLAQIGRSHFEQTAYAEAEKVFSRIRAIAPARLEDMEHYSTILWHLKHDVDLAFLSHELVDLDRQSPQAWCAVGNSFSLQRDHDQAIRCFKRATQLDPTFAYAYTLQGHEFIQNEEYDKAMSSYRASITAENRHYNAWYGLGKVFEKQGKWKEAEDHFRTAHSINQTNPILLTMIGLMLEKQKNLQGALAKYTEACRLNDKGSLWKFRRANILLILGQFEQALQELKVLKDLTPDDANVHFCLGTVHKRLKQKGEAIRHFTMAMNLDPKASHHIKETMEELENEESEYDGM